MGGTKDKGPVSPLWVRIRDKARAGSFCVTLLYPRPQPSLHFPITSPGTQNTLRRTSETKCKKKKQTKKPRSITKISDKKQQPRNTKT